jgi:hypothetical protein
LDIIKITWPSSLISTKGNDHHFSFDKNVTETNKNGSLEGLINNRRIFRVHCLPIFVFQLIALVIKSFFGRIYNRNSYEKKDIQENKHTWESVTGILWIFNLENSEWSGRIPLICIHSELPKSTYIIKHCLSKFNGYKELIFML